MFLSSSIPESLLRPAHRALLRKLIEADSPQATRLGSSEDLFQPLRLHVVPLRIGSDSVRRQHEHLLFRSGLTDE